MDLTQQTNNKNIQEFLNHKHSNDDVITIHASENKILNNEIDIQTFEITPILSTNNIHDIIIIKNNGELPYTQHNALAQFITIIQNNVNITLIPPEHKHYITLDQPINKYVKTTTQTYNNEDICNKNINCNTFIIKQHSSIYIPPLWTYNIKPIINNNTNNIDKTSVILISSFNNIISMININCIDMGYKYF
jgi:hypothetical protein